MFMVLTSVGLPVEDVSLILALLTGSCKLDYIYAVC